MARITHLVAISALVLTASAQSSGQLLPGPVNPPTDIYEQAGRQPNTSTSVEFKRKFNDTTETWTWRVNISDVTVPENSKGLHVANAQWQLDWPDDSDSDSLQEYAAQRNLDLSVHTLTASLPSNVTARYDEDGEGNCGPILGEECVSSLAQAVGSDFLPPYKDLRGCADTLVVNTRSRDSIVDIAEGSPAYKRGDSLLYEASSTYPAEDLMQFEQAKNALRVLFIIPTNDDSLPPTDGSDGVSLTCSIVEKSTADEPDNPDGPEASATSRMVPKIILCGMGALNLLAIM